MNKSNIALILNIAAAALGIVGIGFRLARSAEDFFLYYTQLSNVCAASVSLLYIFLRGSGNERVRKAVRALRYLSSCMLTMTFIVVMCIFIPLGGSVPTLLGSVNGFLHHAVCPVISVTSYVFFEEGVRTRKALLIPFTATAVYAFVIYTLNFLRLAPAPYPFFDVYNNSISGLVIWFFSLMVLVIAISAVIYALNKKFGSKTT